MRSTRREEGAAVVEAAILTPVILLLMLGILEFGFYFKNSLSASETAKAGVRIASAQPRNTLYAQKAIERVEAASAGLTRGDIQQLWVYKANRDNDFPVGRSDFSSCGTCVRYRWDGTSFTKIADTWPAASQVACATSPPDRVGVYLQLRHDAFTRIIFDSVTIREADVLQFEPVPSGDGCAP